MRLATAQKVHYDSGPNMTPLVDIVMVILIFLMLTGTLIRTQFFRANLPVTTGGEKAVEGGLTLPKDVKIEVRVDSVARRDEPDDLYVRINNQRDVIQTDADLVRILKGLRLSLMQEQKKSDDEIQVIISPGRFVKYQTVVRVLTAANEAELKKVAFGTSH